MYLANGSLPLQLKRARMGLLFLVGVVMLVVMGEMIMTAMASFLIKMDVMVSSDVVVVPLPGAGTETVVVPVTDGIGDDVIVVTLNFNRLLVS